ncbi:hypothetical protein COV94_01490, partial [Candidatus Woesearchaeota archaeon CG11_big_fil_rev_8_21_14_0_20_57_5]
QVTDAIENTNGRQVVINRRRSSDAISLRLLTPQGTLAQPYRVTVPHVLVTGELSGLEDSQVVRVELLRDGTIVRTLQPDDVLAGGFVADITGLGATHTITAKLIDIWGRQVMGENSVAVQYGVPPQETRYRLAPDTITSPTNTGIIIQGTVQDRQSGQPVSGVQVRVYVNNERVASVTAGANGRYSAVYQPTDEGVYAVYARAVDGDFESDYTSQTVHVVLSVPDFTMDPPDGAQIGQRSSIALRADQKDAATLSLQQLSLARMVLGVPVNVPLGAPEVVPCPGGCRAWRIPVTLQTDGEYRLSLKASDTLQTRDILSTFQLDTRAPQIALLSPQVSPPAPYITEEPTVQLLG